MSWGDFGTGVAEAAVGDLGEALATPSSAPQAFYGAPTTTNVSVSGLNLGSILQPFQEGAPANGGSGLNYASRFLDHMGRLDSPVTNRIGRLDSRLGRIGRLGTNVEGSTDWFLVGTIVVIGVTVIALKKRRHG